MKKSIFNTIAVAGVSAVMTTSALAGPPPVVMEEPAPPSGTTFSGTLALDVNTHFISYGFDVWGAGNKWNDALFNPSLSLNWDFGNNWSANLGTWWDVNDNAISSIGENVQEVDVWAGIAYDAGFVEVGLTYQEWMYGGTSERIVDLALGFDLPLSPSLTIHGRVDPGASGGDNGVVPVLGIELPGLELGPVAMSFPVTCAFATDGFHGADGGFAYASAGVGASCPLIWGWTLNAGVTYYYTNDSVIPNPDESIFTGMIGVSLDF